MTDLGLLIVQISHTCFVQFYMPLIDNRSMAWSGALLFVILKILFKKNHLKRIIIFKY